MTPQASIAHYRIKSKLGEGGMGAVFRATDTKLNREVAIKVLPESLGQDADRLARFAREAQVLASLNHPNIAAIYGVEEHAIVMELVEGDEPAGPLSVEQALPLIHQLIDALEYAHEKGVVHCDLKPANLKVTPDGRLKVLDFGLAKALATDSAPPDPASSPTLTMRATVAGVIMGTAGYMSPEQARGHAVDKRADIWSFAVIVHELLTGKQLFAGETVTDTLAAVLTRDPELAAVPSRFHRLLRLCLARDPRQRLRDISGARLLLDEPLPALQPTRASSRAAWAIAAVMACAAVTAGVIAMRSPRAVMQPLTRFPIDLTDELGSPDSVAISPDGRRLAYVVHQAGDQNLAIRSLDQPKGRIVPFSQRTYFPFFSPDGQWVGFFGLGGLFKVKVEGGSAIPIAPLTTGALYGGAAWGSDGSIVYAPGGYSGLWRVPAAGGTPKQLTDPAREGQLTHRWPQFLPGDAVLFTARHSATSFDDSEIDVLNLQTGQWKVVQKGGYYGRYLSSGHLLYIHQGTLFAVRFDPDRQETSGQPVAVMPEVAADPSTGEGRFDCSSDPSTSGLCVVWNGVQPNLLYNATWIEESGKSSQVFAKQESYLTPKLSPDGQLLAIASGGSNTDIHVWDSARETLTQLTFTHSSNLYPVWTPDGRHLVFSSNEGHNAIWWIRSDGGGVPYKLYEGPGLLVPCSFSSDGRRLAYFTLGGETRQDLWTLPIDTTDPEHPKAGEAQPFLVTPNGESSPIFSPDGRWIAYNSDESGTGEVYVRPFPGPGGKSLISIGGGRWASWTADGKRLFYTNRGRIMVVDYSAKGDTFTAGKPRVWADSSSVIQRSTSTFRNWDISPDGRRAIVLSESEHAPPTTMKLSALFNFLDELKRKVP